jgi:hypothetical protein
MHYGLKVAYSNYGLAKVPRLGSIAWRLKKRQPPREQLQTLDYKITCYHAACRRLLPFWKPHVYVHMLSIQACLKTFTFPPIVQHALETDFRP